MRDIVSWEEGMKASEHNEEIAWLTLEYLPSRCSLPDYSYSRWRVQLVGALIPKSNNRWSSEKENPTKERISELGKEKKKKEKEMEIERIKWIRKVYIQTRELCSAH